MKILRTVFFITISVILFLSFKKNIVQERIVFFDEYHSRLWIGNTEVNLKNIQNISGRSERVFIAFDSIPLKVWALSTGIEKDFFYFLDVTSGTYYLENEIVIENTLNAYILSIMIYNDNALIIYPNDIYAIINLKTKEQKILDIRNKKKTLKATGNIGYDGNAVYFSQGWYDIRLDEYHEYDIRLYTPRFIPYGCKIIGFNNNHYVVIYDISNGTNTQTTLYRNKFNPTNTYAGSELYFLDGEIIYMSEDSFLNKFAFLRAAALRDWFKYILKNGKYAKTKIHSPSPLADILGIIK